MIYGERSRTKKAILFDIDGTLLDAYDFVFESVRNSLLVHNLPKLSDKKMEKAIGKPLAEFYKLLFPGIDPAMLSKTHREFQEKNFHLIKPFAKTKKTLKKLKDNGFLIAAVSNRSRESLLHSLDLTEISEFFQVVICPEDVNNPKPHQEHLLVALERLKVEPANSYMVGDTEMDILAGKSAEVKTIGVTYGWLGEDIKKHKPDFVIDDIEEILGIVQ